MLSPSSTSIDDWSPRRVCQATLVATAVACGFALAYLFRGVLFLLFVAILIAIALKPLVMRVRQSGRSPVSASLIVYGLSVVALIGALVAGVPMLTTQAREMLGGLPGAYARFHEYLASISNPLVERLASDLPEELPKSLDLDREETEGAIQVVEQGVGYGGMALGGLLAGLATILLAFYWSLHEDRAIRACLLIVPPANRDSARELIVEVQGKLGAYLRGQGLLCLIMAAMVFVVYSLIGLPYVAPLAVAAGILEAVPVFGPVLGAVPALLVALSVSPTKAAWVLGAIVLIQQFEGNVLVPRIMDRSVGVSPLVTLLAIVAFSSLGGLPGAVLAIPIAAIIQLFLNRWLLDPAASAPPPPEGRDAVNRLRFEAQQLVHDVQLQVRQKEKSASPKHDRVEDEIEALARDVDLYLASAVSTTTLVAAADGDAS